MKIGIIFSGTLRCFDRAAFDRYFPGDVGHEYIVVASINSGINSSGINSGDSGINSSGINSGDSGINSGDSGIIQYVKEFRVPDSWHFVNRNVMWNSVNTSSMYFHNKSAYAELMTIAPDVDIVVKFRSEVVSDAVFPLPDTALPLDEMRVYQPSQTMNGVNDQLAYGNKASMAVYCSVYDRIEEYVTREGVWYHPETLLGHHCRKNSVEMQCFRYDYSLNVARNS